MKKFTKSRFLFFIIASILFLIPISSFGYELERNTAFTKNKFLQLKPNGESIGELEDEIRPNIDLKGGSVQEEKELLSAFYLLGFSTYEIIYNYRWYPLGKKIDDATVKDTIISTLKNLRDLMAQVEAEDNLLELISGIINRIEKESIKSTKQDPKTDALLNELSYRIREHIINTFGLTYGVYYSFGIWTSKVMAYSELVVVVDGFAEKDLNKKKKQEIVTSFTEELKELLKSSETFKSQTEDLTVKAVSRNLDSLQEIAAEIKSTVDAKTAKRLYDYSLNIYYGIVPGN